jgi:hypothetical protein
MSKNINDVSLGNLKPYEGKWQSGVTRTIRVPITLADATLEYARQLDKSIKKPRDTSELLEAADILNKLKAKRKKSGTTLADIEEILEILGGNDEN